MGRTPPNFDLAERKCPKRRSSCLSLRYTLSGGDIPGFNCKYTPSNSVHSPKARKSLVKMQSSYPTPLSFPRTGTRTKIHWSSSMGYCWSESCQKIICRDSYITCQLLLFVVARSEIGARFWKRSIGKCPIGQFMLLTFATMGRRRMPGRWRTKQWFKMCTSSFWRISWRILRCWDILC